MKTQEETITIRVKKLTEVVELLKVMSQYCASNNEEDLENEIDVKILELEVLKGDYDVAVL